MAAVSPWGDPSSESFRKRHIREVRVERSVAFVNGKILAAVSALLEDLSRNDFGLPELIESYDVAGSDFQRLGLAVRLDLPHSPELLEILTRWGFQGVAVPGASLPEFRFTGDVAAAVEANDRALADHILRVEHPDVSPPPPAGHQFPGHRDIVRGDHGTDVRFLQLLFHCTRVDGLAGDEMFDAIRVFQSRRGAPQTGIVDRQLWRQIVPPRLPTLFPGDSNFMVRVLQAALAAQDRTLTRVTGVWGVLTSKDVRALQTEFGIRLGRFVRSPEWALLLGPTAWADDESYEATVDPLLELAHNPTGS
jgi:peptidoglycan hydrolase-like protein with peptidoglycan-binding domain